MKLFLDTSSLAKLYCKEADSFLIEDIFLQNKITAVYLSEITKIEYASTVWKKFRIKEISEAQASALIKAFDKDFGKYRFVSITDKIITEAVNLMKYGSQGLRSLDAIQLATTILSKTEVSLFKSADNLLNSFLQAESLPI